METNQGAAYSGTKFQRGKGGFVGRYMSLLEIGEEKAAEHPWAGLYEGNILHLRARGVQSFVTFFRTAKELLAQGLKRNQVQRGLTFIVTQP